jgi:phage tail-like protein
MAISALLTPLPAFRYYVVLGNSAGLLSPRSLLGAVRSAVTGFSECSGLEMETEIYEYAEGGVNDHVHKLPTRTKPGDIVLRRGLLIVSELWDWINGVSEGRYQRKDGIITVNTYNGIPTQAWRFVRGLPIRWSGPALSASQSAVAIESVTITHEGLRRVGL